MAETKPLKVPRWNDDLTNHTEPTEVEKDVGWSVDEEPSGAFWNWLLHFKGQWVKWINERFFDGLFGGSGDEEDFLITSPVPADPGAGGTMTVRGADGVTAGGGGPVAIRGGTGAATTDPGGDVIINGGTGAATGLGGLASMKSGPSIDQTGRFAFLEGGNSGGTDRVSGDAVVKAGVATGDGSGSVDLFAVDANQGAGSSNRSPVSYLKADGALLRVLVRRTLRFFGLAGYVSSPVKGDTFVNTDTAKLIYYDGTDFENISRRRLATVANATQLVALGVFDQSVDIAGNSLRETSIIDVEAYGSFNPTNAADTPAVAIKLDGAIIVSAAPQVSATGLDTWVAKFRLIVRTLGAAGTVSASARVEIGKANATTKTDSNASESAVIDTTQPLTVEIDFSGITFGTADMFGMTVEIT